MSIVFFNDTATTEIYTLSLHDALPISRGASRGFRRAHRLSGLGLHGEPSHRGPARRTLADQKKAKVASPNARRRQGACGAGWLPTSTPDDWCSWTRAGCTLP